MNLLTDSATEINCAGRLFKNFPYHENQENSALVETFGPDPSMRALHSKFAMIYNYTWQYKMLQIHDHICISNFNLYS
jgi:hypothetical protein